MIITDTDFIKNERYTLSFIMKFDLQDYNKDYNNNYHSSKYNKFWFGLMQVVQCSKCRGRKN